MRTSDMNEIRWRLTLQRVVEFFLLWDYKKKNIPFRVCLLGCFDFQSSEWLIMKITYKKIYNA